jgi:glucose-6-phosphate isomerase
MARYEDTAWQMSMRVRYDFNHLMADVIGDAHGFKTEYLESYATTAEAALGAVQAHRNTGDMRWTELPYQDDQLLSKLLSTAEGIRGQFKNFVVLGIGGSALGAIALQSALLHPYYNELPHDRRGGPRVYVLDNIDPDWLARLLDILDPTETCFNVITKSGSTAETMAQFLWARAMLIDRLGEKCYGDHIIATTDRNGGGLWTLVMKKCCNVDFKMPKGVGGRFSVLSAVGLLPAAVVGIDIQELLAGAAYADKLSQAPSIWQNAALMFALTQYLACRQGRPMSVMMPYAQGLRYLADWYAQLWAESLGKEQDRKGRVVNVGPTPIKALGVTDQHSQAQLYIAGPYDKIFTFITVDRFEQSLPIPSWPNSHEAVSYLGGHTFNELLAAEAEGTALALADSGRANATFRLPEINAFTVGQWMYLLEVATAISGELYGINAFDQPGVEQGKIRAYALLGREGFEEQRAALELQHERRKRQYEI